MVRAGCPRRAPSAVLRCGRSSDLRRRCGGSRRGSGPCGTGTIGDLTEQRADRDGVAVLRRDLAEHAGRGRRHLDRHLVGLEFDQGLVDGDGIAGFLEPLADGGFGDGLAECRNADFGHDVPFGLSLVARCTGSSPRKRGPITPCCLSCCVGQGRIPSHAIPSSRVRCGVWVPRFRRDDRRTCVSSTLRRGTP